MGKLKDLGIFGGALGGSLGIGYADLQHVKKNIQKRIDAEKKEEEKIEEMKRKQEPSGAGGETKATPIQHKAGGKVKKYAEGGLEDTMSGLGKKGAMARLEDAVSGPGKKGVMAGLKDGMSAEKGAMAGLEDVASGSAKKGAMAGGLGMKKGGKVSSASKRADGCAIKGKTKGRMV